MKSLLRILIVLVAITVLSAWTYRLDLETVYRGGDAKNMIEEFKAYGLSQTTMVVVGVFKVVLALMLLLGLKFKKTYRACCFRNGFIYDSSCLFSL